LIYFAKTVFQRLGGSVPQDADYYRAENRRLMESLEILEDQVRSLNHDLSDLTKERTELEKESEKDKNLVKELKGEVSVCIDIQKICIYFM